MNDILAVDDEADIVRLVQFTLERHGYKVRTAMDGLKALAMVAEAHPDLIICDIMMPQLDGHEVVRRLRANPSTREIPIIMLTARTGDADVLDAFQDGADLYLAKPFNPMELLAFVGRLLPLPPASQP